MPESDPSFLFATDKDTPIDVESLYADMVTRATGGTKVLSMKAPAMSMEYVKSSARQKARSQQPGSMYEVEFPSIAGVDSKIKRKHGDKKLLLYTSTRGAAAFPAGYGQKSAHSLDREDTIYQLKSTFTSATIAMSKLRARVAARGGDASAVTGVFAQMWGLSEEDVALVPNLEVVGSEQTRLAALEDRSYHSVNIHPAFAGGYRIDQASLAPDALGGNIPINWSRIRTGMKGIAQIQVSGDSEFIEMLHGLPTTISTPLFMEVTQASQPEYRRTYPWERVMLRAMSDGVKVAAREMMTIRQGSSSMTQTYSDAHGINLALRDDLDFQSCWKSMANIVKGNSKKMLERAVELIAIHQTGRAILADEEEDEVNEIEEALLGRKFVVPAYRVTKDRLTSVMGVESVGKDDLPDIMSHGRGKQYFNFAEVRRGGIGSEITVSSAINLAVYTSTLRHTAMIPAYTLMRIVKDPHPGGPGKTVQRLRDAALYNREDVYMLGKVFFDDSFTVSLEAILRNLVPSIQHSKQAMKEEVWKYLRRRTGDAKPCPVDGELPELVEYLRSAPEGWTLYYWARISIGKWQYASCNGILAPIHAGEEMDLISVFKRGVKERALHWAKFYTTQYKDLYAEFKKKRAAEAQGKTDEEVPLEKVDEEVKKYVPPHLRSKADIAQHYEFHEQSGPSSGMSAKDYEKLALAQVKKKFFANIMVKSSDRVVSVGVSDEAMRDVYIESYQARWLSIDRRLERAKETGKGLYLGKILITEHPWGPLQTDFPSTLEGTRQWARMLDSIGWTVDPDKMWEKLEKSITELWGDLSHELDLAIAMIDEAGGDVAEEQTLANFNSRQADNSEKIHMQYAVPLPAFGYTPPYVLPPKVVKSGEGESSRTIHMKPTDTTPSYQQTGDAVVDATIDDDGWGDDDDDLGVLEESLRQLKSSCDILFDNDIGLAQAKANEAPVLTYREIWSQLKLPERTDGEMKIAFCLSVDETIDDPHLDSVRGPVIRRDEVDRCQRMWAHRYGGLAKRSGIQLIVPDKVDM